LDPTQRTIEWPYRETFLECSLSVPLSVGTPIKLANKSTMVALSSAMFARCSPLLVTSSSTIKHNILHHVSMQIISPLSICHANPTEVLSQAVVVVFLNVTLHQKLDLFMVYIQPRLVYEKVCKSAPSTITVQPIVLFKKFVGCSS